MFTGGCMIHKLASNITDFFVARKVIQESEHEIYTYGFDLMISGFMNVLLVISAGIIIGEIWKALIFVFIMVTVRMYTGGYHADTHIMCNIIFLTTFLLSILMHNIVDMISLSGLVWFVQCIGLILIVRFAPLENRNKRLNAEQKVRYRRISIGLYLIYIVIAIVLDIIGHMKMHMLYALLCSCGLYINIVLIIIAGLLVIGIRKEEKNYAEESFKDDC